MPGRKKFALAAAAIVLVAVSGCARTERDSAADVVDEFHAAVSSDDGEAACALLLPAVADQVAEDGGGPCAQAVLEQDVTGDLTARASGTITAVRVAGTQAQVVTTDDTIFLAQSGESWVVTAAVCDPREDLPYDCEVEP